METLTQTIQQKIQKTLPQTSQNSSNSRSSSTDGHFVRFISPRPNRQSASKNHNQIPEIQTKTLDTVTIKTKDTTEVAISKTAEITILAERQTSNKTETTHTSNHVDIITEQIISQGIVKPVLTAEDRDICLVKVEQHDRIKTIENKVQLLTITRETTVRTTTKFPHKANYFKIDQSTSQGQHVDETNENPLTQLLNSVVDHQSLYIQISILSKQVETVCNSETRVSCLSEKLFIKIKENHHVKIQPSTTRLSTANQMPIQTKGTVSVPTKIGPKKQDHTFYVLIETALDCLLEIDFLEINNCDFREPN